MRKFVAEYSDLSSQKNMNYANLHAAHKVKPDEIPAMVDEDRWKFAENKTPGAGWNTEYRPESGTRESTRFAYPSFYGVP